MTLPEELKIRDTDLCIVIGNLLENAVNAVAEDGESKERYVNCVCKVKKGKLLIFFIVLKKLSAGIIAF